MTAPAPDATSPLDERLLDATTGTLELFGIYLGDRLGLYEVLRSSGPLTTAELASAAGIAPRYAREWLEQQAGAGGPHVEEADAPPGERRLPLAPEHPRRATPPP